MLSAWRNPGSIVIRMSLPLCQPSVRIGRAGAQNSQAAMRRNYIHRPSQRRRSGVERGRPRRSELERHYITHQNQRTRSYAVTTAVIA